MGLFTQLKSWGFVAGVGCGGAPVFLLVIVDVNTDETKHPSAAHT